jgi:hypothetical protein
MKNFTIETKYSLEDVGKKRVYTRVYLREPPRSGLFAGFSIRFIKEIHDKEPFVEVKYAISFDDGRLPDGRWVREDEIWDSLEEAEKGIAELDREYMKWVKSVTENK